MADKACEDGYVLEKGDFAECAECGRQVRWDLRDHPLFGFQNCEQRTKRTYGEPLVSMTAEEIANWRDCDERLQHEAQSDPGSTA